MPTWIALLRGIGGGIRPLPMKELVVALQGIGLQDVRTYIQSGNVVFASRKSAPQLARLIEACVQENFGLQSPTFVLSVAALARAAAGNPFPQAEREPKSLHLFFLAQPATAPKLDAMHELKKPSEQFVLDNQVFYLYAPEGFGTSKLPERVERLLGVRTTARNWRTIGKLLQLAKQT